MRHLRLFIAALSIVNTGLKPEYQHPLPVLLQPVYPRWRNMSENASWRRKISPNIGYCFCFTKLTNVLQGVEYLTDVLMELRQKIVEKLQIFFRVICFRTMFSALTANVECGFATFLRSTEIDEFK